MAPAPHPSRRSFLLGAASLAALILLASCSGGSSGPTKDTTADKGLPVQGTTLTYDPNTLVNNGEPITLEWWLWDGEEQFTAVADAYRKIHPNVEIKVVNQPWDDYWTKLPLALQGDKGPAIFNIHNSHHENILPYCAAYDIDLDAARTDFVGVNGHVIDGRVYYLDYGLMTGLIYYNKTMWSAAGLTEADIPNLFDKEGKKVQLDTDVVKADLAFLTDLYGVDKVGSPDFGSDSDEAFGQGLSAMTYNWGHYYGSLKDKYPSIDFGTFQTPIGAAGAAPYAYDRCNGESTPGINKNAPAGAQEAAQDFLKFFLTSDELLKNLCLRYSLFPASASLADNDEIAAHPVMKALGSIDRYIWPGPMPATVEDNAKTAVADVLYNGAAAPTALSAAQSAIDADLAKTSFVSVEGDYAHADEAK